MEYTSCQHCGAKVSINSTQCPACRSKYFFPLQETRPAPPPESLWDKWLIGSTSKMALAGACFGGICGLYVGMSNAGILAALTLGIIGIIAGGVVGGIAAFVLTIGLVIAAYVVPIVLLVALLIYAFSK